MSLRRSSVEGPHFRIAISVALAAFVVAGFIETAPVAAGQAVPGLGGLAGENEVVIDAESIDYDKRTNVVTARGAVKITRGEMVLTADEVRLNRSTQVAEAEGNVVLTDAEGTVTADMLTLNLVEETGSVDMGSVFLTKNRYQLTGRRFEKRVGQSYTVSDGSFTTCRCGSGQPPSWSIRGQQVTVDLEGYASVKGGTFRVKDRPVFYIPWGLFPVRRERQSGLLFPRFGFSNTRGFQIAQPFYVAINKSMDATLSLDVETNARVGLVGEYRYALSQTTAGELQGSYFNEQIRGASSADVVNTNIADPDIPLNRWNVGLTHDQALPFGVHGYADVFRVSDSLFLREINVLTFNPGVDVALRTRRFARSRVGTERMFDRGVVAVSGTWYQDFINDQDYVFRTPPRIEGFSSHRLWDDRVMVHLAGEGVNFERDTGFAGQRLDLRPAVEVPWRLRNVVFGSIRGGFRETAYSLDDTYVPPQVNYNDNPADPGSPPPSILPALDDHATRELYSFAAEAGTSLARVIPFQRWGIERLKHTIEPKVGYLFVPRSTARQAALPLFDDVDRVNQRSVFTYGVTTRLLARTAGTGRSDSEARATEAAGEESVEGTAGGSVSHAASGSIRELARFSLFQAYDVAHRGGSFIGEVNPETGDVSQSDGTRISDLSARLRLTPSDSLSFEGGTDYSLTGYGARSGMVRLGITDPRAPADEFSLPALRGRSRFGIAYRYVAGSAVQEINANVVFRLSKRLYTAYETRYDALNRRFLENRFGVRLISNCECWVVDFGVSDKVNPDETQVFALVSLVGLGQLGKEPFKNSLGAIALPEQRVLGQ